MTVYESGAKKKIQDVPLVFWEVGNHKNGDDTGGREDLRERR